MTLVSRGYSKLVLSVVLATGCGSSQSFAKDVDRLQGEWQLVAAVQDGKQMPADARQHFKATIHGDNFVISRDGTSVEGGTETLVSTATPKTIDFDLGGGKHAFGIYELDGDLYKLCYGKARPTEFSSHVGTGRTLSTWARIRH